MRICLVEIREVDDVVLFALAVGPDATKSQPQYSKPNCAHRAASSKRRARRQARAITALLPTVRAPPCHA
jgi:hypothetical protein